MHFVKSPSSVKPSFVVENLEGRAEPPVIRIAEFRDKIQTKQDVVVVMNGVVEPEPGTVLSFSIIEKLSLEIKLDSSLDRAVDPFRPFLLGSTAYAARASQLSRVPLSPGKKFQPPSSFLSSTSLSYRFLALKFSP